MKTKLLYSAALIQTLIPASALAVDTDSQCEGAQAVGGACTKAGLDASLERILSTLFFIIGSIAVIFLLIGAIRYITSTGDATRIKQAKDTIFYAIAGLIVAIVAQALVSFVISRLS